MPLPLLSRLFGAPPKARSSIAKMAIPPERSAGLRPDDQFLVSFPRSGNTWMRHLLFDVIAGSRPELERPERLEAILPTVHKFEPDDPLLAKFGLTTRILKSHNIADLLGRRMVYIFRDPADSLVSYYHFFRKIGEEAGPADLDKFTLRYLPAWVDHLELAEWQQKKYPAQTCLVTYEQMHEAPLESLEKAVRFLGLSAPRELLASAVEKNRFAQVQAREAGTGAEPARKADCFFRKGRTGTAVEELSPETLEQIEAKAGPLYRRLLARCA